MGSDEWIKDTIECGTLVAVTDDSYIKDRYPHLCSAAFILECSKVSGQMFGSFLECSQGANAYRGELMGLMSIHLIILTRLNEIEVFRWEVMSGSKTQSNVGL